MTVIDVYPPIAAATILNAFLFVLMWREHQRERREGKPAWYYEAGIVAYVAAVGLAFHAINGRPLSGWLDTFVAAMAGEAMGVIVVYSLLYAFRFSQEQPRSKRAFALVLAVGLTGTMFAGLLTGG